jgi:ferric-dicitrate binding protein FerR (iron transport regulator)
MKQHGEKMWELITRILSNEADAAEQKKFQQWLEHHPGEKQYFRNLEEVWEQRPQHSRKSTSLFEDERGLKKLRSKIKKESRKKGRIKQAPSMNRSHFINWKIAASVVLLLAAASFIVARIYWSPPTTKYGTTALEHRIIKLPDGSVVHLNRNSEISFRKGFIGSTRTIYLTGEAYFKVKHNAKKPFIIHTGKAVIKDIGTSFNVKEGDNGNVVVAVQAGSIAVSKQKMSHKKPFVLTENQVASIQKGHITAFKHAGIHNYLSWMDGQMIFKKMPFSRVIRQLDHIYGIHCSLSDSSLADLKLTAYIRNTSLRDVLHMISISLDIHYQKKGKKVVWKKGAEVGNRS